MRVIMLHTRRGSEDGFVVRQFLEGETYDMADGLARYFTRMGQAVPTDTRTNEDRMNQYVADITRDLKAMMTA